MEMDLSYILNLLGEERESYFNAVSPPVMQTSNFAFESVEAFRNAIKNEKENFLYTRGNNPTTQIVRKKIAALEGTEDCLLFSSGTAAIAAVLLHTLQSGDHVVCVRSPYSWTQFLLSDFLTKFEIQCTYVDGRDAAQFEAAIRSNTKLLFLESPNTFLFELQDIPAVVSIARKYRLLTAIDNSYAAGILQQPHRLGVDFIIHTATKYLAGHSDVVAGAVCLSQAQAKGMFQRVLMGFGAIPSPHDAWLLLRGLRTLPLRLQRSAETANVLAIHFAQHPRIRRVVHVSHPSHPQFDLAQKQMTGGCGLFAMELDTDNPDKTEAFCNALKRFLLAVSWGGYESLAVPAILKENSDMPAGYVRFYAGLESPDVLIADIEQALGYL